MCTKTDLQHFKLFLVNCDLKLYGFETLYPNGDRVKIYNRIVHFIYVDNTLQQLVNICCVAYQLNTLLCLGPVANRVTNVKLAKFCDNDNFD